MQATTGVLRSPGGVSRLSQDGQDQSLVGPRSPQVSTDKHNFMLDCYVNCGCPQASDGDYLLVRRLSVNLQQQFVVSDERCYAFLGFSAD